MRYFYVQNEELEPISARQNARVLPIESPENFGLRELHKALLDDDGRNASKINDPRFASTRPTSGSVSCPRPGNLSFTAGCLLNSGFSWAIFPVGGASQTVPELWRFCKLKPTSLDRYYRIIKRFLDPQRDIPFELIIQGPSVVTNDASLSNIKTVFS
jgi:hypothetical protein